MEPLRPYEHLSELEALCIAFECMLKCCPHCDDPLRIEIFSLRYV
jgi:hypothetical protein